MEVDGPRRIDENRHILGRNASHVSPSGTEDLALTHISIRDTICRLLILFKLSVFLLVGINIYNLAGLLRIPLFDLHKNLDSYQIMKIRQNPTKRSFSRLPRIISEL